MPTIHFDEAKKAARDAARAWIASAPARVRLLLVIDLFGKLHVVIWSEADLDISKLDENLQAACATWWTHGVLNFNELDKSTADLYERLWAESQLDEESAALRFLDRHRSRTAWFAGTVNPPWEAAKVEPPIVVFYSFKGGMGRSTALASFAIQRARLGERVAVVDFDLDSPGIGTLLSADARGLTARWGIIDFMLERQAIEAPLADYFHRCDRVSGAGQIVVFPAGNLDEEYTDKLARIDLEEPPSAADSGIWVLLNRIRKELKPNWILLDARTGISEPAGQLLSGIAHLHVLLGTTNAQSWLGLSQILDRLGKNRILADVTQGQVLLIQSMVPAGEAGRLTKALFVDKAEDEFDARYYAADEAGNDERFWVVGDKGSDDAPHVPAFVDYEAKFASFGDVAEIADALCEGQYKIMATRIANRFSHESDT